MSKYIDAEKLIDYLKEKRQKNSTLDTTLCRVIVRVIDSIIGYIESLQQEQLPGIEENGIPGKDYIPVEWVDACERYGKWKIVKQEQPATYDEAYLNEKIAKATKSWEGVDVDKFMDEVRGREPEVDLEKEIQEHIKECLDVKFPTTDIELIMKDVAYTARKFYELGQSIQYQRDRREFSKLKAKEWKEGFDIGRGLTQERRKAIELVVDMLESQPSLPSDLDEAAKKIVIQLHPSMEYSAVLGDRLTIGELTKLVKAGVEWMAGQFEKYLVEPEGAWIDRNGNCFTHTLDADDPIPIKNIVGAFDIFISKKQ